MHPNRNPEQARLPEGTRGRRAGAVRWGLACALGIATMVLGPALANDPNDPGKSGGNEESWSSDPTVGTLPMVGDPGASDQAISLRGTTEAIRAVLRSAAPAASGDVTAWIETIDFGDGTAWVRLYGDVDIQLDVDRLGDVEVGVFSGFEGNGMACVAQTSAGLVRGDDLHAGEELRIDAYRLLAAGIFEDALRLHCVHATGQRSTVGIVWAPQEGTLVLRQDV